MHLSVAELSIVDSWRRLAEQKIVEAQKSGLFDNLDGFGKPISFEDDDPNWWIKQKVKAEGLNLLPPALLLARFVERQIERIMKLNSRSAVIDAVNVLNTYIRKANMKICWGPASTISEYRHEEILEKWSRSQENSSAENYGT